VLYNLFNDLSDRLLLIFAVGVFYEAENVDSLTTCCSFLWHVCLRLPF